MFLLETDISRYKFVFINNAHFIVYQILNYMKKFVKLLSYIPFALLVIIYTKHSIQAFIGVKYMSDIINILELDILATLVILVLVGFHDAMVVTLLLFKDKLIPKLPTVYLYIWVGIWPIIPRFILWGGGAPFDWIEILIFTKLSTISYYLLIRRNSIKLNFKTL